MEQAKYDDEPLFSLSCHHRPPTFCNHEQCLADSEKTDLENPLICPIQNLDKPAVPGEFSVNGRFFY
jgi:hypothetical protein